jgi:hypothetical protein
MLDEWVLIRIPTTVSLIIALLLAGLIVDLGGGPDDERIGFIALVFNSAPLYIY